MFVIMDPDDNAGVFDVVSWDHPSVGGISTESVWESASDPPQDNSNMTCQLVDTSFPASCTDASIFSQTDVDPTDARDTHTPQEDVAPEQQNQRSLEERLKQVFLELIENAMLNQHERIVSLCNNLETNRQEIVDEQTSQISQCITKALNNVENSTNDVIVHSVSKTVSEAFRACKILPEVQVQGAKIEMMSAELKTLVMEGLSSVKTASVSQNEPFNGSQNQKLGEYLQTSMREMWENVRHDIVRDVATEVATDVPDLSSAVCSAVQHAVGKATLPSASEATGIQEALDKSIEKRITPIMSHLEELLKKVSEPGQPGRDGGVRNVATDETRLSASIEELKAEMGKIPQLIESQNKMLQQLSTRMEELEKSGEEGRRRAVTTATLDGGRVRNAASNRHAEGTGTNAQIDVIPRRAPHQEQSLPSDTIVESGADTRGSLVKPPMPGRAIPSGGHRVSEDHPNWAQPGSGSPTYAYPVGQPTYSGQSRHEEEKEDRRREEEAVRAAQRRRRDQERLAREAEELRRRKQEEERLAEERRKKAELDAKTRNLMSSLITHDVPLGKPSLFGDEGASSKKTGLFD